MNRSDLLRLSVSIAAVAVMSGARAQETLTPHAVADISVSAAVRGDAAAIFPVEQVLEALRGAKGLSFIFDSRLISGKMIRGVTTSSKAESALAQELHSVDLQLHKVANKTYAITRSASPAIEEIDTPELTEGPRSVDTILVMGSTAYSPATTGSTRLFKIDSEDLAYLSVTSPADAIYNLPQSLASFTPANTALFSSAAGISLADLRGLHPKRTLVLVNGRRRTITTGGNGVIGGVDLGSLADTLLERIEVQSVPGGARYGGAAVAGAVNFVTKSNFDGLEAGANIGISQRGDSEEISLHALAGRSVEGFGNITFGVSLIRNEGLIGADRSFSAELYGFSLNGRRSSSPMAAFLPGFGGSTITDRGLIGGVILSDGSFSSFPANAAYVPNADGSISQFTGALDQLFNWSAWQNVILPSDRVIGQLSFNTDFSDRIAFFIDAEGGGSATYNQLAPLPSTRLRGANRHSGDAAVIPVDNPFLPQSIKDLLLANFGANAAAVVFDHRYLELGPRRQRIDRRNLDVAAGLRFGAEDGDSVSLTYRFGANYVTSREKDRIDLDRLQVALDPTACAAAAGCSLVDFFTSPQISPAALDFITIPEISRSLKITEHEATMTASAALPFNGDDEGRVTAGLEFRRAAFEDQDSEPRNAAVIGYLGGANVRESVSALEAYADVKTPLIRSKGFPGEFDGSLTFRIANSSGYDFAMNFEGGLDWRPATGIALFTRQHIGQRAPDIMELFAIGSSLETAFVDPCGIDPAHQSGEVAANCASNGPLGVGAGFVQTEPLASSTFYGNPGLEPENVRSGAYGVTLTPTSMFDVLPGRMELTATWLDFSISNVVADPDDVLSECYSSPNLSSPLCGLNPRTGAPAIIRDPSTRQIISFDGLLINNGALDWSGLDLEFRYAFEPDFLPLADTVWISALHTYTNKAVHSYDGFEDRVDGLIQYPRHRSLVSAGVDLGRLSFVAYADRRGKVLTARSTRPEALVPAALYLDLTGRYEITDNAYVQASVKNLTDREPAITAFNDVGNFAPEFYDPIGRRFSLSFRITF